MLSDRVGVGTTSPTSKLHVVGASSPLVTVEGLLTANAFTGDGSGLSNIKAETVANGVYTTGSYVNPG
jgi:hypothetical protein